MSSNLLYRFPSSPTASPPTSGEYLPVQGFQSSTDTVHRKHVKNSSESTIGPLVQSRISPNLIRNENLVPTHKASQSTLRYHKTSGNATWPRHESQPRPQPLKVQNEAPLPPEIPSTPQPTFEVDSLVDIDLNAGCGEDNFSDEDVAGDMSGGFQPRISFEPATTDILETRKGQDTASTPHGKGSPFIGTPSSTESPFRRLMRSLRHRTPRQNSPKPKNPLKVRKERWSLDEAEEHPTTKSSPTHGSRKLTRHKKASSWSSTGLVSAVKTATVGLTAPRSPKAKRIGLRRTSQRSSGASQATVRASLDSNAPPNVMDDAAWERARQRRRTVEELIESEESYVADLKVLANVYFTLLGSATNISRRMWADIHRNVAEILALHQEILRLVKQAFPDSDVRSGQSEIKPIKQSASRHGRWHSYDDSHSLLPGTSIPVGRRSIEISWLRRPKKAILISDPREVAHVARVFDRMMPRFFVYEEYGANYESTVRDMASASKNIPNWHAYERGIEALAHSLVTDNTRDGSNRKGLAFEDLLIKPIQRVCKYPLLFADLYRHTPVIDGPESRAEVEKVLYRLRETTQEINRATNDHQTRARIQRSWQLQDLLINPDSPTAPPSLRLLGHPILCGVLYVAYQSASGMRGDFMLAVLFKSYFLLALPNPGTSKYSITAIISLGEVRIENTDNGRGLQCYTALFSWKIAFESEQHLYEMVLCACSPKEEEQWKAKLLECASKEEQRQREDQAVSLPLYSLLSLGMKPLGQVFGLPGTLARRLSVQRASTVSPRNISCQVIIKNTNALRDYKDTQASPSSSLGRSQSHLTTNKVAMLAPKKSDRARMEHQLAGVWTRDLLPYPGVGSHRAENIILSSASSMIRKLSKASISGQFSKRSASISSVTSSKADSTCSAASSRIVDHNAAGRPRLYGSKSLDLLGMKNGAVAGPRRPQAPKRASSRRVGKRARSKTVDMPPRNVVIPSQTESIARSDSTAAPQSPPRSQRPTGVFKAFSSDNIRGWFNANGSVNSR